VDDLVEGILRMMRTDNDFTSPVNLGNQNEFTMLQLAETILDLTNSSSKLIFKPLPQDDPKQRQPDISLAKKHLDSWEPKIQLKEGLSKTIRYFESELQMIQKIEILKSY
jgi:UDP-glucuronate decarboxylase